MLHLECARTKVAARGHSASGRISSIGKAKREGSLGTEAIMLLNEWRLLFIYFSETHTRIKCLLVSVGQDATSVAHSSHG